MTTETKIYEGLTPSQMTKEQLLKYQSDRCKEYYQRNKEHVKKVASKYYHNNKELVLNKAQQKGQTDKTFIEKRNEYSKQYYYNNIDHIKHQQQDLDRIKKAVIQFVVTNGYKDELVDDFLDICFDDKPQILTQRINAIVKMLNPTSSKYPYRLKYVQSNDVEAINLLINAYVLRKINGETK